MKIGMLWFDNNPQKKLETIIIEATGYYQSKYGKSPTLIYVHPTQYPGGENEEVTCAGFTVKPLRSILPNHLLVGQE